MIRLRVRLLLAFVACLSSVVAVQIEGQEPAAASTCVIPGFGQAGSGAFSYPVHVNGVKVHDGCFRVFKQWANPTSFWLNFYVQETVEVGGDGDCLNIWYKIQGVTPIGLYSHVIRDCGSADFRIFSKYYLIQADPNIEVKIWVTYTDGAAPEAPIESEFKCSWNCVWFQ